MTCVWELDLGCLGDQWDGLDEDVQDRSLMLATSSLQMLTNYRVGTCPITIRPCPTARPCPCAWNPHVGVDGLWRNDCFHRNTCKPVSEIDIPGPVGYIDSLYINGELQDLDSGDFRLDNGHLLVWQGAGDSPFLETQDLSKPDTEPGTYSITYSRSHPVAADGKLAVTYLAIEFAKACQPNKKCQLPRGVSSVVRNGVSFTIEAGLFPGGLTGIEIVDAYILKWAPAGSPTRNAVVFDPSRALTRVSTPVPSRLPLGSN